MPAGTIRSVWRPPLNAPSRSRAALGLLAVTVILPLAILLLGLWQAQRGRMDLGDLAGEQARMTGVVRTLEARMPRDGRLDPSVRFDRGGEAYVGALAVDKAREALGDVAWTAGIARKRLILPPVIVVCAAASAGLSLLVLVAGAGLGIAGRRSRDALVAGFSVARRMLPAALGLQVVLLAIALVAAVIFEAAALLRPGVFDSGEIKLLAVAAIFVVASLVVAASALARLRSTLAAFEPQPFVMRGRVIPVEAAPGLWRLVGALAGRLGALEPETLVVGLTQGFSVSSGPKRIEPGGEILRGRTLYVPLPYLPLMRLDELVAVLGHELAHFSGRDTEYSLRFLPIYVGVGRSLDAVALAGGGGWAGSPLLAPSLRLGTFVMDQFHHAARHWSRQREFAADRAGAEVSSADAAVRALLRTAAIEPRVVEALSAAAAAPEAAADDLVADIVRRVAELGLEDPAGQLDEARPHPTDTHPTTRQRLEALGTTGNPALEAAATGDATRDAAVSLGTYFADPAGLCRRATADFLATIRDARAAERAHLVSLAHAVDGAEQVLCDGTRAGGIVLMVGGGAILLAALALALFGLPGMLSLDEARLVAATIAVPAVLVLASGLVVVLRSGRPFLILRPDALLVPGTDRPILWSEIADLDVRLFNRRMVMRLLLPPEAAWPQRVKGRRVGLDERRRIVTVSGVLPRRLRPNDFVALLSRYRQAAEARRLLAEASAEAACQPN